MSTRDFGTWGYDSGTNGTAVIPKGAKILKITAHASANAASFTIETKSGTAGPAIPVINGAAALVLDFFHDLLVANSASAIVFNANIDHYFVEYVKAGNT